MRDLDCETGQTFVIVTHDSTMAEHTGRTILLSDGRVAEDQTRDRRGAPALALAAR